MKKIFSIITLLVLVMLAFAGCGNNTEEPDNGKNTKDTVVAPGEKVYFITDASGEAVESLADSLFDIVLKKQGGSVLRGSTGTPVKGVEFLIDIEDETRPIIQKAKKLLEREDEPEDIFQMRYLVYANSGQVAIVCDTNYYTNHNTADYVIEKFAEEYIAGKESVTFAPGVVTSGIIDLVAMQEIEDAAYVLEKWKEFENSAKSVYGDAVGAELTAAFQTYYSMFSDKVVTWWADLYDPGMGAFYYSNSSRNNFGYLPGIESTGQVLNDLVSTGMLKTIGGGLPANLPKIMQYQLAYYFKSLQDPDGFFYNPQLGKEGSNSYRIGRDQGHAITRLDMFGGKPTYTCSYNGVTYEGDGLTADEWWDSLVAEGLISADTPRPYVPTSLKDYEDYVKTGKLSATSAKEAVSKVVATSSKVIATAVGGGPSYFKSHADFENWLKQWNPDASPYSACSNISAARTSLIIPDSEALGPAYAPGKWYHGMTLMDMTISYLNSFVTDRGLFGAYVDNGDPAAGCKFANTNGLMKAIGTYNAAGVAFPKPLEAVESCLICIMGDEPSTGNICEVYNVWTALSGVLSNVKKYGTKEQNEYLFGHVDEATGKQIGGRIYEVFGRDGEAAVLNSYAKQKNYQCDDGGFNHSVNGNPSGGMTNGGVPSGIGGVKECNVDAVGFGMHSNVSVMCSSLGISNCVPVYTESDWMRFIRRIVELNPVIKETIVTNIPKVYSFNNYENESVDLPDGMSLTNTADKFGSVSQVGVKGMDGKAGVLQINKTQTGSGTSLLLQSPVNVSKIGCNMVTLEMDLRYSELSTNLTSEIQFSERNKSSSQRPFLIILSTANTADGSPIYYSEYRNDGVAAVSKFASGAVVGEWFKFKIEYFEGDGATYRYRVYINNELIYTSNAIYSSEMVADLSKLPLAAGIEKMTISLNQAVSATLELDNIRLVQSIGTIDDLRVGKPGEEVTPDDRRDPELPPPPIPGGITTPAASDAITYDEEVSTTLQSLPKSGVNKIAVSQDLSGNNILFIDKPADGTMCVYQYPTLVESNAQFAVYEVDLYTTYSKADVLQISINGNGTSGPANSPILILLSPSGASNGSAIRYVDYAYNPETGKSGSAASVSTDAKVGEWFRLRIEYSVVTDSLGNHSIKYSTYINNKHVKTSDYIYSANVYDGTTSIPLVAALNSLSFSFNSSNIGDFAMDNASFRKIAVNDYTDEEIVAPESVIGSGITAPAGALDFDRYLEYMLSTNTVGIETNGSANNKAEVVTVSGGRMMSLYKTDSKAVEFVHYMKNKAVTEPSLVTYTSLMKLDTAPESGEAIITFLDKDGNVGAKVGLSTDADGNVLVKAYKSTSSGNSDSGVIAPKTAVKANEFFTLTVIYSMGSTGNCLKVLINSELVLQGNYYIGVPVDGKITDAHITDVNGFGVKLEGAIKGEALLDYSHFTVEALPKKFVAENTNNGVIEFDKDYSKSLSISVNSKFAAGNTWETAEEDGNKYLAVHKTLKDTEGSSGGMTFTLGFTKKDIDANMMVFEGKFKLANMTSMDYLQLTLNGVSSSPFLGLFSANSKADGSAIINNSKTVNSSSTTAKVGEWFTLRIEYSVTAEDAMGNPTAIKYRTIVNGGTAAEGTKVYNKALKLSEIKNMGINFNNANVGDLYMDDLSLSLVWAEPPHVHSYKDGKCECGEDEPHTHNYVDGRCSCGEIGPHDHVYTDGFCWCGASDPNYVPPLKNGVITFDDPYSYYFKANNTAQATNSTVTEESGNKYHQITKTKGYNKNNGFNLNPTYVEEGAKVAEVQFDIWISEDAALNTQIFFTVKNPVTVSVPYDSSPFLSELMNHITKGSWHTVKIVYAPTSFKDTDGEDVFSVKIFVDGVHKQTITTNFSLGRDKADIPPVDEIACFSFGLNSACVGTFRFDNASFKLLKEASK